MVGRREGAAREAENRLSAASVFEREGRAKNRLIGDLSPNLSTLEMIENLLQIQLRTQNPLLFDLFINDLPGELSASSALLYADDLKIFRQIQNTIDTFLLQCDLILLAKWCEQNNLPLNLDKCCQITFTRQKEPLFSTYNINGHNLVRKSEIRDLGVILDSKLTFIPYINNTLKSARRSVAFIYRNSHSFTQPETLLLLYNTLVRSRLEFATPIWNINSKNLEKNLKKFKKNFYVIFIENNSITILLKYHITSY